ncbi:hypothetical protein BJ508DRAFT_415415, partial [Ascobolus immersus RN42]
MAASGFPLLSLPPELRLTFYSHLSSFTLLQLSHTSSQLHSEINKHPTLVRNSRGYFDRTRDQYRYFVYIRCQIAAARLGQKDETGKGIVTLNIGLIDRLGSIEEYLLFRELYQTEKWRCCETCFRVDRAQEGTDVKRLMMNEKFRCERDPRLRRLGEDGWVCSVCWAMYDQDMDRQRAEYVVAANNERWEEYMYEI